MEQFRQIGEVVGSLKALMVFHNAIRINQRQCSLLVDACHLAFDGVAEELRSHLRFEEKSTKWRALEHPLKELHRVFREGEQYIKQCLEPGDWWCKAISLNHNTDAIEFHLHNLLWCVPVVIEAIENVAESVGGDHDEIYKKKLVFSKKYERDWMEPKLFQLKLGKSYLNSQELRARLDTAWKEDHWILSETIEEMRSSGSNPLTKQENRLADLLVGPRGKLFPNSVLVGSPDYQVRRRFGAGSNFKEVQWMGESFSVKHAIGDVEPLMNEISILSSVSHPNVMHYMYSFIDEEKKECFMVMELMTKDLSSYIRETCSTRRKSPFPLLVAVDTMLQIARGMEYLHSKKIYHGDLNPSNILVKARSPSADGYLIAKITGFALSPAKNSKTSANQAAAATNHCIWHSPEVLLEQEQSGDCRSKCTEKADIYSFAMICFELLTGKVPFEDNHLQGDKMSKNIRAGERPLFPSQTPKYLANLTKRCWHSDPSQRPSFASLCRVLRYIKRFLIMNPDQNQPDLATPPVDYFDMESSLSKIVANWATRGVPRISDIPFQMYSYRVLEREKTSTNVKDRSSESGSEGASVCGDENAFNGILPDDALSTSFDSVALLPQLSLDTNKTASTRKINGKPNKQLSGQNQKTRMVRSPNLSCGAQHQDELPTTAAASCDEPRKAKDRRSCLRSRVCVSLK
ncbi:tyrosine-protein kinase ABL1-like [Canna indica]|uniref:Tyrosine-protein kinase ABL1-like n=1 Tax=Canna indica TaxID=4628 RepID=A0AAQ3JXE1_9LILI|nr:tyrosine-protein kinase ABL1-like [Canna indica]